MELVDRLLARIPADHPARARVEEAGLLLSVALEDFAKAAITAAHRERRAAARRLRIFVTLVQGDAPLEQVVDAYAALREHHELVPWRAVNDVLEGLFGEEGEQEVKRLAAAVVKAKKREPTPPLASWRKPRPSRR